LKDNEAVNQLSWCSRLIFCRQISKLFVEYDTNDEENDSY